MRAMVVGGVGWGIVVAATPGLVDHWMTAPDRVAQNSLETSQLASLDTGNMRVMRAVGVQPDDCRTDNRSTPRPAVIAAAYDPSSRCDAMGAGSAVRCR